MNAVHMAEQSTLGCLMLEPTLANSVSTWLRADDFSHPWHRSVFTTIRELNVARTPIDPTRIGQALFERFGSRRADLPSVVDLLQAVPIRPQGQRYASMVLEASLRREVSCQGVILQAAALSAALTQRSEPVTRITTLIDTTLAQAEERWLGATDGRPDVGQRKDVRLVSRDHDTELGADRLFRAHPPIDPAEVRQNEERLIASLVTHPNHIASTAAWLRPDAPSDPKWRPVYAALVQLDELAQPIDVVTVTWEVQRTSARLGAGPGTRELREAVELAETDDPTHCGRIVAGDQLRIAANHGADTLRAAAANPGIELVDVLQTGHLVASALRETAGALATPSTDARTHLTAVRDTTTSRVAAPSAGVLDPVAG
jgi:hypothetical protein